MIRSSVRDVSDVSWRTNLSVFCQASRVLAPIERRADFSRDKGRWKRLNRLPVVLIDVRLRDVISHGR
jgi:hypothetical protein